MGLYRLCKHMYTASKSASIRYYKLNPSSLPSVRASFSPVSGNLLGFESCSMLSFGRRHFCVGRNQNGKFQPMVKYLSYLTVFFKKFETVPFTKQILLVHPFFDKLLRDSVVENIRDLFEGEILPDTHAYCVRVKAIARKILKELQRESGRHHTLAEWSKEGGSVVKLVQETRKISTLEGRDWEIYVLDNPEINAASTLTGKIVINTALCDFYKTDAELAFVIGHEIGHVLARHPLRKLTWCLFDFLFMPSYILKTYLTLRQELQADYIGICLSASAGYDPRVAPLALEKVETEYGPCTFMEKRIKFLSQQKVMKEAVTIYQESIKTREY